MNELDTYIPPNIRLITRSLSGSHPVKDSQLMSRLGRAEPGPNAKINSKRKQELSSFVLPYWKQR